MIIAFDKDGTLVDIKAKFEPIMKARQEGFNKRLLSKVGVLTKQGVKEYMIKEIDKIFNEVRTKGKVIGIQKNIDLLKKFYDEGCYIYLITMDTKKNALRELTSLKILKYFSAICSGVDKATQAYRLGENVLFIGDTKVDREFALRSGMKFRRA